MQQSALALAVLAALYPIQSACAQDSVQVYGRLDAGVEALNHAGPEGGMVRVISGGKNTSRWGLRGSEDLGGGVKAVFNLEGGILVDSGAADGALFKRQAYVGLEGSLGRLVLGRSFTTTYDLVIKFDPMGFAPNYSWATGGSASGPSNYGMTTSFGNLVKYSGGSRGFTYGASVGLGEQAGSSGAGRKLSLGGAWSGGGTSLMAAWEQVNGEGATAPRDRTRAWHLAADHKAGPWRVTAGLRSYERRPANAAQAALRGNTWWGGVTRVINRVTLTGAVYHTNTLERARGEDADPTMYVARAMLALSGNTDLYLSAAHARAQDGQLVGLSRDDPGAASTQAGVTAGIQYRF